jgi:hypothetical protein
VKVRARTTNPDQEGQRGGRARVGDGGTQQDEWVEFPSLVVLVCTTVFPANNTTRAMPLTLVFYKDQKKRRFRKWLRK